MKIAFMGTHGTGKTTLSHELVSKLKKEGVDVDFLGEIARRCPFPLNEKATKKAQIWVILNQIISEMECEDKCETLICDRSVLDGYCYYVNKFGRAEFLEPLVLKHLKTYNYLIKVPIREGLLKKDKMRSINKKFQKDIDEQFEILIKKFKIKHLKITDSKKGDAQILEKVLSALK